MKKIILKTLLFIAMAKFPARCLSEGVAVMLSFI